MDFIATQASDLVQQVDEQSRLAVAIVVIVWISAIASSFIDNIPFTTAMVRRDLYEVDELISYTNDTFW